MAEYGVPEIFPILFVVYKNNELGVIHKPRGHGRVAKSPYFCI